MFSVYGSTLEDDLMGDTSGNFKRLMVSLCCANRDESFDVDPSAVTEDVSELLQAGSFHHRYWKLNENRSMMHCILNNTCNLFLGELRFGTDESTFNAILVRRSVPHLQEVFAEYEKVTGHSIESAIENEFSGDIEKGLIAIGKMNLKKWLAHWIHGNVNSRFCLIAVKCVNDRAGYFAEQLYKSMKGLGSEDRRLIRLVVTRSEVDMKEIKQAFMENYGQSLENFISV